MVTYKLVTTELDKIILVSIKYYFELEFSWFIFHIK